MSIAGIRIKECRLACKLTQEDVAKQLGIGKQAVYKYEVGAVTNIPLENLESMAALFSVSPEYLAGWSNTKISSSSSPSEVLYDPEEIRLVSAYRAASPETRKNAMMILESSAAENKAKDAPILEKAV